MSNSRGARPSFHLWLRAFFIPFPNLALLLPQLPLLPPLHCQHCPLSPCCNLPSHCLLSSWPLPPCSLPLALPTVLPLPLCFYLQLHSPPSVTCCCCCCCCGNDLLAHSFRLVVDCATACSPNNSHLHSCKQQQQSLMSLGSSCADPSPTHPHQP